MDTRSKSDVIANVTRRRRPQPPAMIRRALLHALAGGHVLIRHPRTRWHLVDPAAADLVASAIPIPCRLAAALLRARVITQRLRHPRTYVLVAPKEPRHAAT